MFLFGLSVVVLTAVKETPMSINAAFTLNKSAHAAHCLRCLGGLPAAFMEADTSRMAIGFYCLGTLDLLGILYSKTTNEERQSWRDWIWAQQAVSKHGTGFRAGPFMTGSSRTDSNNATLVDDTPHLIMTYTALLSLAILRDNFAGLDRIGLCNLLRQTQKEDGSFTATPGQGEADMRNVYTTFAICHMLDDWSNINIETAVSFIRRCRTYEGGYGQAPFHEAHGGSTYCALASLHLIPAERRLGALTSDERRQTLRWLIQNQVLDGGFRGRTEKVADACYSFWCSASINILGSKDIVNAALNAAFLHQCQYRFGGIAKAPKETADPYHTYLSLASLAMYPLDRENDSWNIAKLDPLVNATEETASWVKQYLRRTKTHPLGPVSDV